MHRKIARWRSRRLIPPAAPIIICGRESVWSLHAEGGERRSDPGHLFQLQGPACAAVPLWATAAAPVRTPAPQRPRDLRRRWGRAPSRRQGTVFPVSRRRIATANASRDPAAGPSFLGISARSRAERVPGRRHAEAACPAHEPGALATRSRQRLPKRRSGAPARAYRPALFLGLCGGGRAVRFPMPLRSRRWYRRARSAARPRRRAAPRPACRRAASRPRPGRGPRRGPR